jgi:hypothetical protein
MFVDSKRFRCLKNIKPIQLAGTSTYNNYIKLSYALLPPWFQIIIAFTNLNQYFFRTNSK